MKRGLDEYYAEFGEVADKAGELARNLGLGAIATIWIFKNPEHSTTLLPRLLVWALLLAVLGLAADLAHYVFKAGALYKLFKEKEKLYDQGKLTEAEAADFPAPAYIERVAWGLFGVKIGAVALAYLLLLLFLAGKL